MAKVDTNKLKSIIEYADGMDVAPFVSTAELLVNEELADKGLSDDRLDEIAHYLAAHCVSLRERQSTDVYRGSARDTYAGVFGMKLNSSQYGQMALLLDTSGTLESIQDKSRFRMRLLSRC